MKNKKIFSFVLLLSMITAGGGLWAQELKFDGYINSGVGIVYDDKDGVDPYFKAVANDAEHQGYRFRLNGSYTNEAKNVGAKFRFQSQTNITTVGSATTTLTKDDDGEITGATTTLGTPSTLGYFSLPYAFGWVSFFDNKLTVNGGIVEDSTWSTGDWWLASDSVSHFTGLGALLKLTPIDGLALGVGGYAINRRSGSSNNTLYNTTLGSAALLENVKWTVHGAYTMKDAFRLGVSFRTASQAGTGDALKPDLDPGLSGDHASSLYGEFRFLGMKDLTAVVATRIEGMDNEDFGDKGTMVFSETFGYKIDSLNIGLNAVQFLYNTEKTDASLLFNLWGSYAIDNTVPRLDVVYFMNGTSNMVGGQNSNTWHRHAFTNGTYTGDDVNHMSVFSIRPSVKINLDGRTFLEIGDMINIDSGDKDGAYKDEKDADKKSRLTNVFYIDLKWSF